MYPSIVYEDVVHFKVGVLAGFLILELDECVLERVARDLIPDDFAAFNFSEPTENYFQVVISGDGIQLTNEQDVFRRSNISVREITYDFQDCCSCLGLAFLQHFLDFLRCFSFRIVDVFVGTNSAIFQTFRVRRWRSTWNLKAAGIVEGVFQDDCVCYSDVLVGTVLFIHDCFVEFAQHLESWEGKRRKSFSVRNFTFLLAALIKWNSGMVDKRPSDMKGQIFQL